MNNEQAMYEEFLGNISQYMFLDGGIKVSALGEVIEIIEDEKLIGQLTVGQTYEIGDYHPVVLGGKEFFRVGSGKQPASILRIAKKFSRAYQEKILHELISFKKHLTTTKAKK